MTALIPQLAEMREHLCTLKTKAEAFRTLTPEQWFWSSAPNVWSLALIVDHLNTTERAAIPLIEEAIETLRRDNQRSEGPFHYGWGERFFIRILSPNPPLKVPVPSLFIPKTVQEPLTQALEPFLELQERYLQVIERANGYDLKAIKVTSPSSSLVKMTVGSYLESMVAHGLYHWTQVEALLAHPQFPSSKKGQTHRSAPTTADGKK